MAWRVALAAAVSSLLMFAWGFFYWVVLGMIARLAEPLPAQMDVLAPLRAAQTPDGVYLYPAPVRDRNDQEAVDRWEQQVADGPLVHLAYRQEGVAPTDVRTLVLGWAHQFILALLAGALLSMVVHTLPSYASRLGFLLLLSLVASLWTNVGNVIYWFYPVRFAAGHIAYEMVAGLLMALVTAALVRPLPAPAAKATG